MGRQRSESCLPVRLPVIVKGVQAQPGPAGDPSPKNTEHGAAAFPGLFAQGPQNILSKQGAGGGGRPSPCRWTFFCSISKAAVL